MRGLIQEVTLYITDKTLIWMMYFIKKRNTLAKLFLRKYCGDLTRFFFHDC